MEPSYLGTTQSPVTPVTESERILGILAHVLTLVAWFFAPLIIYLLKKDESEYVRDHARESMNFQLTIIVAYLLAGILTIVFIGFFFLLLIAVMQVILVIVATVKAADSQLYRYPYTIKFIK